MRVAREMIGGPFARPAFTFVAVVTRQVVSRRSAAGQVRLVLRAVKSRRLDLVSCSLWGGEEGRGKRVGARNQSYRWHRRWLSKNFKALPPPPAYAIITARRRLTRAYTPSPPRPSPVFVPICRLRPPGNCY